ncbi:hypothetical protein Rsub_03374 [Raphidocelis subcapitata]|uniref:Uncharacterized protein n=1 Tax=Raphidocelis subcapitata TaxID=307507 RepID=A0A2V0NRI9_9CHLO|nr:hypothetical protein Rsub_03374 [Raphidocelis subcapitata]|eukprot:GBF90241.1 hypothetical protein Rsub_03374 [Raphidocelis subcapitata]
MLANSQAARGRALGRGGGGRGSSSSGTPAPAPKRRETRPARRTRISTHAAANDEARGAVPDFAPIVSLGDGAYILRSFVRPAHAAAPRFDLDLEGALQLQLDALQRNNSPYPDHGVEVMYRFAAFDPFERSKYFGRSFDLGQFERFRRVWHTPAFKTLLNHDSADVIGRFQMGEGKCALRVLARHDAPLEERTFTVTMVQRQGGPYDGYWLTDSVICDSVCWDDPSVIISW